MSESTRDKLAAVCNDLSAAVGVKAEEQLVRLKEIRGIEGEEYDAQILLQAFAAVAGSVMGEAMDGNSERDVFGSFYVTVTHGLEVALEGHQESCSDVNCATRRKIRRAIEVFRHHMRKNREGAN